MTFLGLKAYVINVFTMTTC